MYIVANPARIQGERYGETADAGAQVELPAGYRRFLKQYGPGTYRDWLYVQLPDPEVLKPFVEYEFWEHDEESPITLEQLTECVVTMSTIDGDFIAVHPAVDGLIWLPRHSEQLRVWTVEAGETWTETMDRIMRESNVQDVSGVATFDPESESRQFVFMLLPDGGTEALRQLASECSRQLGGFDLVKEKEHSCYQYVKRMGGWIRYNYAYGKEVAVCYEAEQEQVAETFIRWLESRGCRRHAT